MANKQRFNWLQGQRVDVPHLKSIEDGVIFDLKALLTSFVGTSPYVLSGFTIPSAQNYIQQPATSLQVNVSGAIVWMPGQADGSYLTVPSGTPNEVLTTTNTNVVGTFTPNATNYVSLQLLRQSDPSTNDLVSIWNVDSNSEFTKDAPLGLVLNYQIVINTSGFGSTNLPIAIVNVNSAGACTSITNAKTNPFRLGQGGSSPNPFYSASLTAENPLTVTSNSQPDPFATGDFNLANFKAWMDMVMSRILNISGGSLWYVNGSSLLPNLNLIDLAFNSEFSVMTGAGSFVHDPNTAGLLEWTSDVHIKSIMGPLTYTISEGNVQLSDQQVGYISLVRHQDFQPTNQFTFVNGNNTVTGASAVSGISAGDWISYALDNISAYAQVQSVTGSSITLTSNYTGSSVTGKALRCQGTYSVVTAADPSAVPVDGSTYWLAKRDDSAFTPLTIATPANNGLVRSTNITTVTTTAAHGLVVGQSVAIAGASDTSFNALFDILTVPSSTTFTVNNPGPNAISGSGTVSSVPKIYLRLRGGNGELEQGESAQIDDTTLSNILRFIGSQSETDTTPPYTQFPSAECPYSFTSADSLTNAVSAITGNVNNIYNVLNAPAYEEPLLLVSSGASGNNQINGPISSGTTINLPLNSRTGLITQYYTVGKGWLDIFLNGQYLPLTVASAVTGGWTEVGVSGSQSTSIQINQNLVVGDVLDFKIRMPGGPGSGSGAPDDDFIHLATDSTTDNSDYILIYDVTISAYRKQTRATFLAGVTNNRSFTYYSANQTLTVGIDDFVLVDASAGPVTITLPSVVAANGTRFTVKKKDSSANLVTIVSTVNIDFALSQNLSLPGDSLDIVSDGTQYWLD